MRQLRSVIACVVGTLALVAGSALAVSSPASATPGPWPDGTVFLASSGDYCSYGGGGCGSVVAYLGTGGAETLYYGEPYDVTVDNAGDVFWTDCNTGIVDEFTPTIGVKTLLSDIYCPLGIAYDGSTDSLLVGSGAANIMSYDLATGTTSTAVQESHEALSISVDGGGDIFFSNGVGINFVPAGSTTPAAYDADGSQATSVRVGEGGDLVLGTGFGDSATVFDPTSDTLSPYGPSTQYSDAAVADSDGDLFGAYGSSEGDLFEIPAASGTVRTLATGLDGPAGLAAWPPSVDVGRAPAEVTLTTTTPSSVDTGYAASFAASVTDSAGDPLSGYVELEINGSVVGSPQALVDGSADFSADLVDRATGEDATDDVAAVYLGTSANYPAVSDSIDIGVDEYPVTMLISKIKPTASQAEGLTVRVSVSGGYVQGAEGVPTGTIEVNGGGTGPSGYASLVDGVAKVKISLQPGEQQFTLDFYSDGSTPYLDATSPLETVDAIAPYVSVTDGFARTGTTVAKKTPITLYVTVEGQNGLAAPTGTISAGAAWTCSALTPDTTDADSTATCTAIEGGFGERRAVVKYAGDANYRRSHDRIEFDINNPSGGGGDDD